MQVTQLVDVTDVHVLLVDLGFVEVLGSSGKNKNMFTSFSRVEMCGNPLLRSNSLSVSPWGWQNHRFSWSPSRLLSCSPWKKWFVCLIPPVPWQSTLAQLLLCITCNPAIVQQVLWPTWQMRFPSLARSPARSSPAGCTENTGGCLYWGVQWEGGSTDMNLSIS